MAETKLEFVTRKTRITIDYSQCVPAVQKTASPSCGFACVKACRLYGRNILKIEANKPVLAVTDPEEIKRLDNECISCEYNCQRYGPGCISIEIPLDLEELMSASGGPHPSAGLRLGGGG